MKTIKKRIEDLEENQPNTIEHHYEMFIGWGDTKIESQYFRDGEPITRAEYFREAPRDGKIEVVWGETIPKRKDADENNQ